MQRLGRRDRGRRQAGATTLAWGGESMPEDIAKAGAGQPGTIQCSIDVAATLLNNPEATAEDCERAAALFSSVLEADVANTAAIYGLEQSQRAVLAVSGHGEAAEAERVAAMAASALGEVTSAGDVDDVIDTFRVVRLCTSAPRWQGHSKFRQSDSVLPIVQALELDPSNSTAHYGASSSAPTVEVLIFSLILHAWHCLPSTIPGWRDDCLRFASRARSGHVGHAQAVKARAMLLGGSPGAATAVPEEALAPASGGGSGELSKMRAKLQQRKHQSPPPPPPPQSGDGDGRDETAKQTLFSGTLADLADRRHEERALQTLDTVLLESEGVVFASSAARRGVSALPSAENPSRLNRLEALAGAAAAANGGGGSAGGQPEVPSEQVARLLGDLDKALDDSPDAPPSGGGAKGAHGDDSVDDL
eukprot:SAG22_NODE_2122_length_2976_cov_2.684393_2_plen_419_part_00